MTDQPRTFDDSWRKAPGKKNRRRWCRGKAGIEHQYPTEPDEVLDARWHYWILKRYNCTGCGRAKWERILRDDR